MAAQLRDLGRTLPDLWAQGQFTPAQQKGVVWISGAVTPLQVHPPILRQSNVHGYEQFVERVLALGNAGYQDREIAHRLPAEGFRAARSARIPRALVGEVRRARGHISLTE
jgi:hypothetical protein